MNIIKLLWLKSIFMFLISFVLLGCGNSNSTAQHTQSSVTVKVSFSNMEVNNKLSKQLQKISAEISRITLDVNSSTHFYVHGKPFVYIHSRNGNYWAISLPALPISVPLTFTAKAYNVEGTLLYKGSYSTTLLGTVNNNIDISLTPIIEIEQQVPTLSSLVFQNIDKTELLFTIHNPNRDTIHYQITANQEDDGSFSPDYGDISFEQGETAQLQVHYNKPTTAGTYHYLFTMTDSNGNSFIATFNIEVINNDVVKTENTQVHLNLPPSIASIEAQSSPNSLILTANAHDDSEDTLSYEWSLIEGDVNMEGAIEDESYLTKTLSLDNYGINSAFKIKLTVADAHGASSTMVYSFNGNHVTRVRDYQLLFFALNNYTKKRELWKIDGSGHPIFVKELDTLESGIDILNPIIIDGIAYFSVNDGTHGRELWRSDGTANGTYMVKDINLNGGSYPDYLTNFNGILYFSANDGTHGRELWRSDGTINGTYMIKDIKSNGDSYTENLINVNGILYFSAKDTYGRELWRSDGTADGTYGVRTILGNAYSFNNVNGILYFNVENDRNEYELWRSDGTIYGTYKVKDTNLNTKSIISDLTNVNGFLYFSANDDTNGIELWRSNGTIEGTYMVKDINPNRDSDPSDLTNMNGRLYFSANDGTHGDELWKSDGTADGTKMVIDINPNGHSLPMNLINVNGVLYFKADDGINGKELWRSDGTANGTYMVKDINPSGDSSLHNFINVNGVLYFTIDINNDGYKDELWKSNGTEAGTVKVFPTEP